MSELSVGSLSGLAANSYVIDVASGSSLDLSNGATLPAGSILQVVQTVKTDTFSTTSASYVTVTGLTVSITPSSASSKILLLASVNVGVTGDNDAATHIRFAGGNATAFDGDAAGSRALSAASAGANFTNALEQLIFNLAPSYLDSPATTSPITYSIQTRRGAAGTAYINRTDGDADNAGYMRTASSITVMEVAG